MNISNGSGGNEIVLIDHQMSTCLSSCSSASGDDETMMAMLNNNNNINNPNGITNGIGNSNNPPRSISPHDAKRLNKLLILASPNLKHKSTVQSSSTISLSSSSGKTSPIEIQQQRSLAPPSPINHFEFDSGMISQQQQQHDDATVVEEDEEELTAILSPTASPTLGVTDDGKRIHRVVLTGGPCAGKTTSINRIKVFFENIGWKVFVVPETATLLLSSGISFYELDQHTMDFQENLLKTLLQIEDTITATAKFYHEEKSQNCIVIYDRGAMDPVAYLNPSDWETLKSRNSTWNEVDLRDRRYDQIIHMVTAAKGAEKFYALDTNTTRTEGIEMACALDKKTSNAWIGHPYIDVIDNSTGFDMKIARVLQAICLRTGIQLRGCDIGAKKRKFLVRAVPDAEMFPAHQDFNVVHNYLVAVSKNIQARIRRRGQANVWTYTYTVRVRSENEQTIETYKQIDKKEYDMLLKTADTKHYTIYKLRRCFEWNHCYFQLDMYEEPCNPACRGLAILSTHSIEPELVVPDFLDVEREITDDPHYSMYKLSTKPPSTPKPPSPMS